MGLLDDLDFPIPCPECGKETSKTIAWTKRHHEFTCPACGAKVSLDTDDFRREVAKAERAWEDVRRGLDSSFEL